jgi:hypothetical protein
LEERAELARVDEERANERSAQERLLDRLNVDELPKDLRDRLKIPVLVQIQIDGSTAFKEDRQIRDHARIASVRR